MVEAFEYIPKPKVVFGAGTVERLGELAKAAGFRRTLLTADPGFLATPHVERAQRSLEWTGGFNPRPFDELRH